MADLQTVVRLAATAKIDDPAETVWARATLGELHLGLGHQQEALDDYEQATADPSLTWFNIRSMFEQVQLFQLLGYQPETVEPVAALLEQRLAELPHRSARFDKVVICSGHMIDKPDRKTPRFPAGKAEAVRAKIAQQLEQWNDRRRRPRSLRWSVRGRHSLRRGISAPRRPTALASRAGGR